MSDAPDFGTSNYPSAGKIIGPAWQQMWDQLAHGRWMSVDEIATAVPTIARRTVQTLLVDARRAGVLESEVRRTMHLQNRRRRFYRRPEE